MSPVKKPLRQRIDEFYREVELDAGLEARLKAMAAGATEADHAGRAPAPLPAAGEPPADESPDGPAWSSRPSWPSTDR